MEKINICIPVRNNSSTILETLESIRQQSYQNFEVIVSDNDSSDNTVAKVMNYMHNHDIVMHIFTHSDNVGCGGNLNRLLEYSNRDILVFLCADDILLPNALENIAKKFEDPEIALVGRYYYWFDKNPLVPIRLKRNNEIVALADQISGMAIRKQYIKNKFSNEQFVEMASVIYPLTKKYKYSIIEEDLVAVRTGNNPYTKTGIAFKKSPAISWYNIIRDDPVLVDKMLAHNFIGLVHIKNYGSYRQLIREIGYLYWFDTTNILNPRFWFFSIGCLLTPRFILRRLVPFYKHLWSKYKWNFIL